MRDHSRLLIMAPLVFDSHHWSLTETVAGTGFAFHAFYRI